MARPARPPLSGVGAIASGLGQFPAAHATSDDVYDQIKALNDHVDGFGHPLFFGQGGFLDHADTVANITFFGQEVMPRLRELNPEPAKPTTVAAAQ
ncbi:MAG: hypothetical protein ACREE9_16670 [Stellaceae bacterium]